jgi:hypothetical protein
VISFGPRCLGLSLLRHCAHCDDLAGFIKSNVSYLNSKNKFIWQKSFGEIRLLLPNFKTAGSVPADLSRPQDMLGRGVPAIWHENIIVAD